MKYKIGDKVRVKRELKEGDDFDIYVSEEMAKYAGKIVTIAKETKCYGNNTRYEIKEDRFWNWTEDMFEDSIKPTKEELLKMPIGTIIKTDSEKHNIFVKVGENDFCNDDTDHIEDCNIGDDLKLDVYFANEIVEIQEPAYTTLYKKDTKVKEITISEIEKELGYPIKIIKED